MVSPHVILFYASAWRNVIRRGDGPPPTERDVGNFVKALPRLREYLSCAVCRKLLNLVGVVYSVEGGACDHYVCKDCRGKERERESRYSCEKCRDWSRFKEDSTLAALLTRYGRYCTLFLRSPVCTSLLELKVRSDPLVDAFRILDILDEGAKWVGFNGRRKAKAKLTVVAASTSSSELEAKKKKTAVPSSTPLVIVSSSPTPITLSVSVSEPRAVTTTNTNARVRDQFSTILAPPSTSKVAVASSSSSFLRANDDGGTIDIKQEPIIHRRHIECEEDEETEEYEERDEADDDEQEINTHSSIDPLGGTDDVSHRSLAKVKQKVTVVNMDSILENGIDRDLEMTPIDEEEEEESHNEMPMNTNRHLQEECILPDPAIRCKLPPYTPPPTANTISNINFNTARTMNAFTPPPAPSPRLVDVASLAPPPPPSSYITVRNNQGLTNHVTPESNFQPLQIVSSGGVIINPSSVTFSSPSTSHPGVPRAPNSFVLTRPPAAAAPTALPLSTGTTFRIATPGPGGIGLGGPAPGANQQLRLARLAFQGGKPVAIIRQPMNDGTGGFRHVAIPLHTSSSAEVLSTVQNKKFFFRPGPGNACFTQVLPRWAAPPGTSSATNTNNTVFQYVPASASSTAPVISSASSTITSASQSSTPITIPMPFSLLSSSSAPQTQTSVSQAQTQSVNLIGYGGGMEMPSISTFSAPSTSTSFSVINANTQNNRINDLDLSGGSNDISDRISGSPVVDAGNGLGFYDAINSVGVSNSSSSSSLSSLVSAPPTLEDSANKPTKIKIATKSSAAPTASTSKAGKTKVRTGCRCGNAASQPSKLTCCGQRCVCYVDGKACLDCKCKGCNNPYIQGGKKLKLLQGFQAVIDAKTNSAVPLLSTSGLGGGGGGVNVISVGGSIGGGGASSSRSSSQFNHTFNLVPSTSTGGNTGPQLFTRIQHHPAVPTSTQQQQSGPFSQIIPVATANFTSNQFGQFTIPLNSLPISLISPGNPNPTQLHAIQQATHHPHPHPDGGTMTTTTIHLQNLQQHQQHHQNHNL